MHVKNLNGVINGVNKMHTITIYDVTTDVTPWIQFEYKIKCYSWLKH